MNKGLFSIIITLTVAIVIFGGWMYHRQQKILYYNAAEDLEICINQNRDTLYLKWKDHYNGVSGFSSFFSEKDETRTLHLSYDLIEGGAQDAKAKVKIDSTTKHIEIYDKKYSVDEISTCE